jgi:hypothetical protein
MSDVLVSKSMSGSRLKITTQLKKKLPKVSIEKKEEIKMQEQAEMTMKARKKNLNKKPPM